MSNISKMSSYTMGVFSIEERFPYHHSSADLGANGHSRNYSPDNVWSHSKKSSKSVIDKIPMFKHQLYIGLIDT